MSWRLERTAVGFDQYRDLWDRINESLWGHVLLDSRFVSLLIRHFAPRGAWLGICERDGIQGMAVLTKTRSGIWQTFQPSQSPLGLFVIQGSDQLQGDVWGLLESLPGYPLEVSILQQDPDFSILEALEPSATVEKLHYIETPRLSLRGTFEDYWSSRGKNLRHNLARQRRRLEDQHVRIDLQVTTDAGSVAERVRAYGRLEEQGWKGRHGTAVSPDNAQGRFFTDLLETFCETGEGAIYQLRADGKVVASDLCLQRNGMLVVLKTAYEEGLKGFSPALLMRQEIMKRLHSDGTVRVVEYYGRVRDWHRKWTDEIRSMYHLNIYRHPLLRKAKDLLHKFSRRRAG